MKVTVWILLSWLFLFPAMAFAEGGGDWDAFSKSLLAAGDFLNQAEKALQKKESLNFLVALSNAESFQKQAEAMLPDIRARVSGLPGESKVKAEGILSEREKELGRIAGRIAELAPVAKALAEYYKERNGRNGGTEGSDSQAWVPPKGQDLLLFDRQAALGGTGGVNSLGGEI